MIMQQRTRKPRAGTGQRRRQIIEAALACFTQNGIIDTTMEEIQHKAGVSNGSLYHHFKNKDQLVAAVYLEGILDYQTGLLEQVTKQVEARNGILALVRFHLGWVNEYPEWSAYLFQSRSDDFSSEIHRSIATANQRFFAELEAYFHKFSEAGMLKNMSSSIRLSLLLGPCQQFAQLMVNKNCAIDLTEAVSQIGEGIWLALKT